MTTRRKHHPHTVTIRTGPRAGEAFPCDPACTRTKDHYLEQAPGLMVLHPRLF